MRTHLQWTAVALLSLILPGVAGAVCDDGGWYQTSNFSGPLTLWAEMGDYGLYYGTVCSDNPFVGCADLYMSYDCKNGVIVDMLFESPTYPEPDDWGSVRATSKPA
jgi:hypothetical protein